MAFAEICNGEVKDTLETLCKGIICKTPFGLSQSVEYETIVKG